jgi:hypothetical protein
MDEEVDLFSVSAGQFKKRGSQTQNSTSASFKLPFRPWFQTDARVLLLWVRYPDLSSRGVIKHRPGAIAMVSYNEPCACAASERWKEMTIRYMDVERGHLPVMEYA